MDKEHYKDLSSRAADGDAKAFSMLYEMLYREMYYTAYYTLADDEDACGEVIGAARDTFNSISKLRTEDAFEMFMMRTLCARIKTRCREYTAYDEVSDEAPDVKRRLWEMPVTERLCAALYIVAKHDVPVIAAYTGLTKGAARKRIAQALDRLELE